MGAITPKILAAALLLAVVGTGSSSVERTTDRATTRVHARTAGGDGSDGNIRVVVPALPPERALGRLCLVFLSRSRRGAAPRSKNGRDAAEIAELIAATGGTTAATTAATSAWCASYLQSQARSHAHERTEATEADPFTDGLGPPQGFSADGPDVGGWGLP